MLVQQVGNEIQGHVMAAHHYQGTLNALPARQ